MTPYNSLGSTAALIARMQSLVSEQLALPTFRRSRNGLVRYLSLPHSHAHIHVHTYPVHPHTHSHTQHTHTHTPTHTTHIPGTHTYAHIHTEEAHLDPNDPRNMELFRLVQSIPNSAEEAQYFRYEITM